MSAEGRRFIYRASVAEGDVRRSMVADLTERLFGGSAAALASHLLESHEVDPSELDELQRKLAEAMHARQSDDSPSSTGNGGVA